MQPIAMNYAPRANRSLPRAPVIVASLVIVAVVALTGWLAFLFTAIGHELFRQLPPGSSAQVLSSGVLMVVTKDATGSVITQTVEPMKPTIIPAVLAPLAIIFALACYGCYALYQRKFGVAPPVGTRA